jgi:hypothetical protein
VKTGEVEVEAERDGALQKVMKPTFDLWIEAWTPGDTIDARSLRDKQPYRHWADQGFIHAPKGQSIRFDHVAQAVAEYAHDFDVKCLAYDRYAFRRGFEPECEKLGISVEFVEHPQGGTKKGQPTDAMKQAAKAEGQAPKVCGCPVRYANSKMPFSRARSDQAQPGGDLGDDVGGHRRRSLGQSLARQRARTNKIDCAVAGAMVIGTAVATGETSTRSFWEAA